MIELNGIAHIQLTVNDADACVPWWEKLCHFLGMKTLIKGDDIVYCIGSRTGVLVRSAAPENKPDDLRFDQWRAGLHHFCFRARSREDVEAIHAWVEADPDATSAFLPAYDPHGVAALAELDVEVPGATADPD